MRLSPALVAILLLMMMIISVIIGQSLGPPIPRCLPQVEKIIAEKDWPGDKGGVFFNLQEVAGNETEGVVLHYRKKGWSVDPLEWSWIEGGVMKHDKGYVFQKPMAFEE